MKIQYDKEVEQVLINRVVQYSNQPPAHELLIKGKRLPESKASWELIQHL